MSRLALLLLVLGFTLQVQAQLFSQGPPASATSPTADGRTHGAPASVLSPRVPPVVPGRGPVFVPRRSVRVFGTPHRRQVFVPVPVFYPIYSNGYDPGYPSPADPSVAQASDPASAETANDATDTSVASSEDALRQAYVQGVRDALAQQQGDSRYGLHYMDSRESARNRAPIAEPRPAAKARPPDPEPEEDNSPSTVFIFKDGHKLETRNYAIMGQTLFDFSSSNLKKVTLTDLDKPATVKANDDRGITVKLQ